MTYSIEPLMREGRRTTMKLSKNGFNLKILRRNAIVNAKRLTVMHLVK